MKEVGMAKNYKHGLAVDQSVKLLENGKVIDEGILRRVGSGGNPIKPEVEYESQKLHPGEKVEFAFFSDRSGWRYLFEDPMTRRRCFSQRSPIYTFQPV